MNWKNAERGAFPLIALVVAAWLAVSGVALAGPHLLVDVRTGRVLEHQDAFQRWYPASLTKLMTAYVAFKAIERGEVTLKSPVLVSEHAAEEPASKMYLAPGTVMTLDAALTMMIVKSANDIAMAIAESIAGSQAAFAKRMNAQAERLGMTGTHFVNPNGLPDEEQYTTARDMALLALAIRREFPEYAHYFSTEAFTLNDKTFEAYNLLLGRYPGADGMKTGFICASGFNQVSSATRNGRSVISVVLGEMSQVERTEESARLLEKGLQSTGTAGPLLASLDPYGEDRHEAPDLRPVVCSDAARAARLGERAEDGDLVFDSPLIHELQREPRAVEVSLGGTSGPLPTIAPHVPIPTPRPPYHPPAAEATPIEQASTNTVEREQGTAAPDMPIPVPRPES